jgi:hypothetical protein
MVLHFWPFGGLVRFVGLVRAVRDALLHSEPGKRLDENWYNSTYTLREPCIRLSARHCRSAAVLSMLGDRQALVVEVDATPIDRLMTSSGWQQCTQSAKFKIEDPGIPWRTPVESVLDVGAAIAVMVPAVVEAQLE